jgi:hypothetical protein
MAKAFLSEVNATLISMLEINVGMVSIVFGILKQFNTGEASQVSRQTLIPNYRNRTCIKETIPIS